MVPLNQKRLRISRCWEQSIKPNTFKCTGVISMKPILQFSRIPVATTTCFWVILHCLFINQFNVFLFWRFYAMVQSLSALWFYSSVIFFLYFTFCIPTSFIVPMKVQLSDLPGTNLLSIELLAYSINIYAS